MSRRRSRARTHLALSLILSLPLLLLTLTALAGVGPYRWLVDVQLALGDGSARPMSTYGLLFAFLAVAMFKAFLLFVEIVLGADPNAAEVAARTPPGGNFIGWLAYGHLAALMFGGMWACWRPWPNKLAEVGWALVAVSVVWNVAASAWLAVLAFSSGSTPAPTRSKPRGSVPPNRWQVALALGVLFGCLALFCGAGMFVAWMADDLLGSGSTTVAAAPDPPPADGLPGLVAYWPFDEADGPTAADRSANLLDGRVVGCNRVAGVRGRALALRAPGDFFDYGESPRFNFPANGGFTVAVWVRTRSVVGTIVSHRNSRDGGAVVYLGLDGGNAQGLVRQDGGEAGPAVFVTGGPINDGAWHHLALVRAGDRCDLFVDGVPAASGAGQTVGGSVTTDWRSAGREQYWVNLRPFGHPHFDGDLDELAVYGRALSAAEVARLAGR
jgi:hypothetical protein